LHYRLQPSLNGFESSPFSHQKAQSPLAQIKWVRDCTGLAKLMQRHITTKTQY
jgi:hypothetical protein